MHGGPIVLVLTTYLITSYNCLGISSKLDFGNSQSPKIITSERGSHYRVHNNNNEGLKRKESTKKDFDGIGVLCISGGCNKTSTTVEQSKDSIKTDVVVHVRTSVDLSRNKTNFADDTPDVPVIVGVAGSNLDSTVDDNDGFAERPLIVTNIDDEFGIGKFTPSAQFSPNSNFYPNYNNRGFQSDNVYIQESNVAAAPRVDFNIKTLPPITVTMSEDGGTIRDFRYKVNGIETRIPYFEPTFNNHYFGENAPPQLLFYPKRQGTLNPVEFKYSQRPKFLPSLWRQSTERPMFKNHNHHHTGDNNCKCNDDHRSPQGIGLQWNPNRRNYNHNADPGSQINDKLAPLNK